MNFRPRRGGEDPEINLISLIDVLMVLLVFFMLCSTFVDEGRMNIQLPTASEEAHGASGAEPIVVTVTQQGGYRVNERELVNSGRDTLRRAVEQVAGKQRDGRIVLRADGRATHPVGGDCDGCAGPHGLHATQHRHHPSPAEGQ